MTQELWNEAFCEALLEVGVSLSYVDGHEDSIGRIFEGWHESMNEDARYSHVEANKDLRRVKKQERDSRIAEMERELNCFRRFIPENWAYDAATGEIREWRVFI